MTRSITTQDSWDQNCQLEQMLSHRVVQASMRILELEAVVPFIRTAGSNPPPHPPELCLESNDLWAVIWVKL
jgi:hypothetical protein